MRYYLSTLCARLSKFNSQILVLAADYTQFISNVYFDFELTVNSLLFQFFRKFLYADYA